jgi:hypothetical protein
MHQYEAVPSEDGVFPVEMALFGISDEELRSVRVRSGIRH